MSALRPELWKIPLVDSEVLAGLAHKQESLINRIQRISQRHRHVKFASSLAVEDLVIMDVILRHAMPIQIFSLETGRLNKETLALIDQLAHYYPKLQLSLFYPNQEAVQQYEQNHGAFAFYESVELRRQCCFIRKIEPLNRALADADAWLTGQRREQSITRSELTFQEHDSARHIAKYNPIFDWSEQDVWGYILQNNLPFNALYHQGYPSIGCEPCTKPVHANEDIRAGRWWWENQDSKECGLHK